MIKIIMAARMAAVTIVPVISLIRYKNLLKKSNLHYNNVIFS